MGNTSSEEDQTYVDPSQPGWRLLCNENPLCIYHEPDGIIFAGKIVLLCAPIVQSAQQYLGGAPGNERQFLQLMKSSKMEEVRKNLDALRPLAHLQTITRSCLQRLRQLMEAEQFTLPPICALASAGYEVQLQEALSLFDIRARDSRGNNALHLAVCNTSGRSAAACVSVLLDSRWAAALLSGRNKEGKLAVHLAAAQGNVELIRLFLANRCDLELGDLGGYTALHCAVAGDKKEAVDMLLRGGANIFAKAAGGKSCVHIAAEKGASETLKLLLGQYHANVNEPTENGETPLHLAMSSSSGHVGQILLESGAQPCVKNGIDQDTPLHYAAKFGETTVATIILVSRHSAFFARREMGCVKSL